MKGSSGSPTTQLQWLILDLGAMTERKKSFHIPHIRHNFNHATLTCLFLSWKPPSVKLLHSHDNFDWPFVYHFLFCFLTFITFLCNENPAETGISLNCSRGRCEKETNDQWEIRFFLSPWKMSHRSLIKTAFKNHYVNYISALISISPIFSVSYFLDHNPVDRHFFHQVHITELAVFMDWTAE